MTNYRQTEITAFIEQHYTTSLKSYFDELLRTDAVACKWNMAFAQRGIGALYDLARSLSSKYETSKAADVRVKLCACLHNLQIKTTANQIKDLGELVSI